MTATKLAIAQNRTFAKCRVDDASTPHRSLERLDTNDATRFVRKLEMEKTKTDEKRAMAKRTKYATLASKGLAVFNECIIVCPLSAIRFVEK